MNGTRTLPQLGRRLTARAVFYAIGAALALLCTACGSGPEVADHPGKAVYQQYCYACHQAGIADAPILGDKDAWAPRLSKTRAELLESVIQGMVPGMPPRAGCGTCTDDELAAAVDFMVLRVE